MGPSKTTCTTRHQADARRRVTTRPRTREERVPVLHARGEFRLEGSDGYVLTLAQVRRGGAVQGGTRRLVPERVARGRNAASPAEEQPGLVCVVSSIRTRPGTSFRRTQPGCRLASRAYVRLRRSAADACRSDAITSGTSSSSRSRRGPSACGVAVRHGSPGNEWNPLGRHHAL